MKKINIAKLVKGDIILTTSTKPKSKLIQQVTKSDISHAMIYVANGSVIDSTGEGVHARNISKMFYKDECAIYAYRPVVPLTDEQMQQLIMYVRSEIGSPYALSEAMFSPYRKNKSGDENQFCSRLVARAYARVGLELADYPEYATPADLQRSSKLQQIENVVLTVSTEEEKATKKLGDTTKGMRNVSNKLLRDAKKIDGAIRTLSDIEPLLLQKPGLDKQFAEAFLESGYLDYWKVEVEKYPWRYDMVRIVQFYHATNEKEALLNYCRETLESKTNGDYQHWKENISSLRILLERNQLETFQLELKLYIELCLHHELRVQAAKLILNTYGERHEH
uniref:YiiX/YebB-like N1pC/P60 family cysteine hydrolase n=1 Tax=Methylomonas sp. SPW-1 TaxID=3438877 RepID=UPI00402B9848